MAETYDVSASTACTSVQFTSLYYVDVTVALVTMVPLVYPLVLLFSINVNALIPPLSYLFV